MSLTLLEALSVVGRESLVKTAGTHTGYSFKTKDATFISYIDAHLKQASSQELEEAVNYARFWNILPECQEAMNKIAQHKPQETPDSIFALCQHIGSQKIRKYASYDADSTREAAIAFYDNRNKYPLSWRAKTAAELLNRAEKYEMEMPEYLNTYLHKAAGAGYPTEKTIEDILISRRESVKLAYAEEVDKLSTLLGLMADDTALQLNCTFVKQAVECLENFDVACGLTDAYDRGLPLPEELIATENTLPALSKIANSSYAQLVNGVEIDVRSLRKTALAAVDPRLGNMDYEELVEVLPTLPYEDADLLVRLQ